MTTRRNYLADIHEDGMNNDRFMYDKHGLAYFVGPITGDEDIDEYGEIDAEGEWMDELQGADIFTINQIIRYDASQEDEYDYEIIYAGAAA
jgi:hypothetical protein